VRLGRNGIHKRIFLGMRSADADIDYIAAFVRLARAGEKPLRRRGG
jgi:LysR family transcriptional regulator for metE and metH